MRSEYVFAATREVTNRFLLCRMTSISARRLQAGSRHMSETINQSLKLIADAELTEPNNNEAGVHERETEVVALAVAAE